MTTLPPSAILIAEDRQRTELDLTSLRSSIQRRGIITPIVVTSERQPRLIAGERRLRCALELGLAEVPVRWLEELDPIELQIIELEENIKRKALTWQEDIRATERIHRLYGERAASWTQARTADAIGLDQAWISRQLRVARDLEDPNVAKCGTTNEAYNLLMRRDERARASALDGLLVQDEGEEGEANEAEAPMEELWNGQAKEGALEALEIRPEPPIAPPRPRIATGILQADFSEWWRQWRGPKFNLLHCDFPYGIGLFNASGVRAGSNRSQVGQDEGEAYEDDPETYERLVKELCEAINGGLTSSSCHLMFWFSNKWQIEQWTRGLFASRCPQVKWSQYPLVWLKTDNAGVAAIPSQQPRHIYEVALFGTIGDRPLVRLKSDAYAAQTDKSLHVSCKPAPVLRHFMEMLVDEHTTMLDPTCGSGTSVRAAESLGAKLAIGLELDQRMAELAERARVQEETKRRASGLIGKVGAA